jgi:hypothetical protein
MRSVSVGSPTGRLVFEPSRVNCVGDVTNRGFGPTTKGRGGVAESILLLLVSLTCVGAILLYRARHRAAERRRWWPGDADGVREFRATPRASVAMVPSAVLQSVGPIPAPPDHRTPTVPVTAGRAMAAAIRGRGNAVAASRYVESQTGVHAPQTRAAHG